MVTLSVLDVGPPPRPALHGQSVRSRPLGRRQSALPVNWSLGSLVWRSSDQGLPLDEAPETHLERTCQQQPVVPTLRLLLEVSWPPLLATS